MLREHRFHFALHEKLVWSTVFTFGLGLGGAGGWGLGLGPGLGAWLSESTKLPATPLRWLAPPARALRQICYIDFCHLYMIFVLQHPQMRVV